MRNKFIGTMLPSVIAAAVLIACGTYHPYVSLSDANGWTGNGDTVVVDFSKDGSNKCGNAKSDTIHVGTDTYVLTGGKKIFNTEPHPVKPAGKTVISDTIEVNYEIVFY